MVSMWRIRHAVWRTEVNTTRYRSVCILVNYSGVYPISAGIDNLYLDAFVGLDSPFFLDFTPVNAPKCFALVLDFDGRRRRGRYFNVRWAALVVLRFTPTSEIIIDKGIGSVLRQRMRIGRSATINIDFHIKRFVGIIGLWKRDFDFAARTTRDRTFVEITKCDCCNNKPPFLGLNLN